MGKKRLIFSLLIFLLLILLPAAGLAAEYRTAERIIVGRNERVTDDLFIGAGDITVEGEVDGDLFVWGGQVRIDGRINGDVMAVGGNLYINGQVSDDIRVAGGNVQISGRVGDDLMVGAGNCKIFEGASVKGDLMAGAGMLTIAGKVGSVKAGVGELIIDEQAQINGNLEYWSEEPGKINDQAQLNGSSTHHQTDFNGRRDFGSQAAGRALSLVSALLIGLLLVYILPNFTLKTAESWRSNSTMNFLWGLLALIALPVVGLILIITLFGLPLGMGVLLFYPIILYLAKIVTIVSLGFCLQKYFKQKVNRPDWLSVVIGGLICYLIVLIPVIGALVLFVLVMIGLGALVSWKVRLLKRLRAEKSI